MVVFDATTLLLFFAPDARPPFDPATGVPVARCQDRVEHLVATFERDRTKVIVPTPVLSEILVRAGEAGVEYLNVLNSSVHFKIVPFDTRAAVELAAMTREASSSGDKKGGSNDPWAKVKFDRQIVAIACTEGAKAIYSDDQGIYRFATRAGIEVIGTGQLPLPPEDPQHSLFGERPSEEE